MLFKSIKWLWSKREFRFLFFIVMGCVVSESHNLFVDVKYYHTVNWFLDSPENPPYLVWYIKELGDCFKMIFWSVAVLQIAQAKDYRIQYLVLVWVFFNCGDLALFFLCFREYGYMALYFTTLACGLLPILDDEGFDTLAYEYGKSKRIMVSKIKKVFTFKKLTS